MIKSVKNDPNLIGIIAIENTIAGSLLPNYDLIRESDLFIIGENKLHISHCIAALPNETLETINEVNSHPIALMQCQEFLNNLPNVKVVEKDDTASSAKRIALENLKNTAAICSEFAAERYGLNILKKGIETNKRNFTRFLLVANPSKAEELLKSQTIDKSSIVFTLPHKEGSLSKILTILSFYDINLTKIQSLPIIGREWEYLFYVDLTFDNFTRYKQSLDAVRPLMKDLNILGEYKSE